ncbi:FMN-dependent NADH-azoreductase [Streptomyces eurythermus]|uniref:FMN-dependent NADH-azoreductase n=1 Tax=Streptomyces eurythermus TaxID=42237 RepID=UPI00369A7EA5
MPRLLHLDASARRDSYSRRVGRIFAEQWQAANPSGEYVHRDLAADPVPHVDEALTEINEFAAANGINGVEEITARALRTPEQKATWAISEPLVTELLAADVLLIGTPMYNFSVPSTLKAWLDRVIYPWVDLKDTRAVIVTARGGSYAPGTPRAEFDYQETYLRALLSQCGLAEPTFINTELTLSNVVPFLARFKEVHTESYTTSQQSARELAGLG